MDGLIARDIYEQVGLIKERITALEEIVKEIATLPTVKKEAECGSSDCEGSDRRDAAVGEPSVPVGEIESAGSPEPGDDEVRAAPAVVEPEAD
jgi:hypothetical protein